MANELARLFVTLGLDSKEFQKNVDGIQKKMQTVSKNMAGTFRAAGIAMVATGGIVTAMLGMATKAAAEEQAGITRLSVAMRNMGIEYDQVRDSLEAWIDTQQQKTSISDTAQRSSLASLIRLTGDLTKAQDLLTLAMDMAVGTGKELESATTMVMYAMGGNWGMVERYIPALKTAANEEEKWAKLREMFAGQAEAYGQTMAGQMELLQNNIGDLKEEIGGFVAEAVIPLIQKIQTIVQYIKPWIQAHPELIKWITLVAGALGAMMLPLGAFLIALPSLLSGFAALTGAVATLGLTTAIATGGIVLLLGIISAAAMGLVILNDDSKKASSSMEELSGASDHATASIQGVKSELDELTYSYEEGAEALKSITKMALPELEAGYSGLGLTLDELAQQQDKLARATQKSINKQVAAYDEVSEAVERYRKAFMITSYYLGAGAAAEEAAKFQRSYWGSQEALEAFLMSQGFIPTGTGWLPPGSLTPAEAATMPIPEYQYGGIIPGPVGAPQMAIVHGGEEVLPAEQQIPAVDIIVPLTVDGEKLAEALLRIGGERYTRRSHIGGLG